MVDNSVDLKTLSNVVIYGAGAATQELIQSAQLKPQDYQVCSTQGGGVFLEQPVIAFKSLKQERYNIIIASQYFFEIYSAIQNSAVNVEQVYCFNVVNKTVLPVNMLLRPTDQNKTLYAVYDLEMNPASFDACVFANAAEHYRIEKNYDNIHFVVIPPILKYGRLCDAGFYHQGAEESYRERIENLLIPIFSLIPSKIGCSVLAHRKEAPRLLEQQYLFPQAYSIDKPKDDHNPADLLKLGEAVGYFRASTRSRKFVSDSLSLLTNLPVITFTLREYQNQPSRNNDVDELVNFLAHVKKCGFYPLIVRDTEKCGQKNIEKLDNYQSFPSASLDIGIRMALYESAEINFFVNNGPVALACFNPNVNYMVFKLVDDSQLCTTHDFFKHRYVIKEGDRQYFWAQHGAQQIFWQPDTFYHMREQFERYLNNKK